MRKILLFLSLLCCCSEVIADGIGFQFSDILSSKNGSIKPAIAESTIVPINDSNDDYKFMTVWLIKTKPVIDAG
ncbi:hypothetical protein [Klebsiella pneumoniae]|uniref:hypothetical protein n=1 Tax=Klebsiella pneumoniae TaxID=573 RepID=UPI0015C6FC8F|nr:hypothetical protein [Klebsiella pneumoniae]